MLETHTSLRSRHLPPKDEQKRASPKKCDRQEEQRDPSTDDAIVGHKRKNRDILDQANQRRAEHGKGSSLRSDQMNVSSHQDG